MLWKLVGNKDSRSQERFLSKMTESDWLKRIWWQCAGLMGCGKTSPGNQLGSMRWCRQHILAMTFMNQMLLNMKTNLTGDNGEEGDRTFLDLESVWKIESWSKIHTKEEVFVLLSLGGGVELKWAGILEGSRPQLLWWQFRIQMRLCSKPRSATCWLCQLGQNP